MPGHTVGASRTFKGFASPIRTHRHRPVRGVAFDLSTSVMTPSHGQPHGAHIRALGGEGAACDIREFKTEGELCACALRAHETSALP